MASLERYAEVRRRYPGAEMLMGIGNLTELTAADTTGVNALLVAVCQELGIRAVLTTEVIPWARGAVREIDVARRLMHYAVTRQTIPKGVDDRLVTVKDPAMLTYTEEELRALQASITDPNFRIFADPGGDHGDEQRALSFAAPTSRRSSRSSTWTIRHMRSTWARSSRARVWR